eukprot:200168_1
MNGFLRDYIYATHINRGCFGYDNIDNDENESKSKDFECDINNCFIVARSNRNKNQMGQHNKKRRILFFIDEDKNGNKDNDEINKNTYTQQICDALHCWVYHTPKININKYIININDNDEEEAMDDELEFDLLIVDDIIKKLGEMIMKTRKSSNRFRNTRNTRYESAKGNKFMTNQQSDESLATKIEETKEEITEDDIAIYQSAVYGNDKLLLQKEKKLKKETISNVECWMDVIFNEIITHKFDSKTVKKFVNLIKSEEYATESIYDDLHNEYESNIFNEFTNDKLHGLLRSIVFEKEQKGKIYSAGYRFFYHKYYKENGNKEWNILYEQYNGKPAVEGNAGFLISDWVINSKYKDFKTELLNNKWSPFSLSQYNDILEKATIQLQNWLNDKDAPPLQCQYTWHEDDAWTEKMYGIKHKEPIKLHHIMALMFYCNFSKHSYSFSSTFRKMSPYETNQTLKDRHSEFYYWGKYLREC